MILFSPRLEISRRLLLPEFSFLTERRHVAVVDERQCTGFEDLTNYKCSNFSAAPPPSHKFEMKRMKGELRLRGDVLECICFLELFSISSSV